VAAAVACESGPPAGKPVSLKEAHTPEALSAVLESIAARKDAEACAARARIYARLRDFGGTNSLVWRAKGDAADIDVLSQPAPPEMKAESAGRLAKHFLERAKGGGAGALFKGAHAEELRRFVLLSVAVRFGEYAVAGAHAEALEDLAVTAEKLAESEDLRPEVRKEWSARSKAFGLEANELRAAEEKNEVTSETRKFCEADLARHLEEATRAADRAPSEKAGRGDAGRVMEGYLSSLAHFSLARESIVDPTPAQEHALSGMEIVAQSLGNLIRREP
jgi:hypothetical protein